MRTLLIFIMSVLSCSAQMPFICGMMAQQPPPSGSGSQWYPTNVGSVVAYYRGDTYYTNSGVPTMRDEWTNSWNLTAIYGSPADGGTATTGSIDSQKYVHFVGTGGNGTLISSSFTNIQTCELVMLARFWGPFVNAAYIFCDTADNVDFTELVTGSTCGIQAQFGAFSCYGPYTIATNTWYVIDLVLKGASSTILTNNATYKAASDAGTKNPSGFRLGGYTGYANLAQIDVAQAVWYGAELSSGDRNLVYNFFKTNYPSASLP